MGVASRLRSGSHFLIPCRIQIFLAHRLIPFSFPSNPQLKRSAMEYLSFSPFLLRFGSLFFFLLSPVLLPSPAAATARFLRLPSKPDPADAAATARWLAEQNSWGVLSTISIDLGGAPFGNVVSFSDGLPGNGHGIPYFYLTELDPTSRDALQDARSSLTVSEYPLGTCGKTDPENPSCSKLTLTGKLKLVSNQSAEAEFAQTALFTKHPEMKGWPKGHKFKIFRLDVENIFLVDWFGGSKPLTPAQYLKNRKKVKYLPFDLSDMKIPMSVAQRP